MYLGEGHIGRKGRKVEVWRLRKKELDAWCGEDWKVSAKAV